MKRISLLVFSHRLWWLGGFVGALLLAACHPTQHVVGGTPETPLQKQTFNFLKEQAAHQRIDFKWFTGKAKAHYKDSEDEITFQVQIKIRKDSLIWISVSKSIVEGARAVLTPDSFKLLDRQNKEYYPRGFAFIQREFHLPVDFNLFQDLIIGNAAFGNNQKYKIDLDNHQYRIESKEPQRIETWWLNGTRYQPERIKLEEPSSHRQLSVEDNDFEDTQGRWFSKHRLVHATDGSPSKTGTSISLDLHFHQVIFDEEPKNLQFNVPDNYTTR